MTTKESTDGHDDLLKKKLTDDIVLWVFMGMGTKSAFWDDYHRGFGIGI